MKLDLDQTIAAVATAPGEGGIGIIRISGSESQTILKKVFWNAASKKVSSFSPGRMLYGTVRDSAEGGHGVGKTIDEVMVVYMKAPHSYTGEDVAEIQCHGSVISLQKILQLVLRCGARLAERGEFTQRAFLNGRIDLSQAEAVIDVIQARSEAGHGNAVTQLQGALSGEIRRIRRELADLMSNMIAHIEYPDEDLEDLTCQTLIAALDRIMPQIQDLMDSYESGKAMMDGIRIALVGRPNVGKSSLLNMILREDRAIVTSIPGTTRDTIEEAATVGGIPVKFIDTAGIRSETEDVIEKIGIEKSLQSIQEADVVIVILDASSAIQEEDRMIVDHVLKSGGKKIMLLNKTDLEPVLPEDVSSLERLLKLKKGTVIPAGTVYGENDGIKSEDRFFRLIKMSAQTGEGRNQLAEEIRRIVYRGEVRPQNDLMVTNARHVKLMEDALQNLKQARGMLEIGEALDFAEMDVRTSWSLLGEITGDSVNDDIIQEVFSRFCLGK